ncbi:MAG TPA: phospholipid carrier-dependent glycosyltransferase [Rhodocyclaceae bacterium]|nr:phospholipid carrier-dependent glycosyltransferase [Rhodocyclaceae bacterium]
MKHVARMLIQPRWLCLFAIFGFSLVTHFWGLSRFNGLVFDEVFFPKYAQNYLDGAPFFDAHPPLGKYLIALGMRISEAFGAMGADINIKTGAWHPAWAYRWVDALAGSLLPLVFAGIAWQLSRRWKLVLITALLTSLDGLFLVESRYGLINIFLVLFGLLGHYFYLSALAAMRPRMHWMLMTCTSLCFGLCVSVKWSGMAFLAIPWGMWIIARLQQTWLDHAAPTQAARPTHSGTSPLQRAGLVSLPLMLGTLIAIPLLVYVAQYQPHLRINNKSFIDMQKEMYNYHQSVKDGPSEHPYCSRWSTWPTMQRPLSYLFTTRTPTDPEPTLAPPDTDPATPPLPVHAIHAMGNPVLWWLAIPATLLMFCAALAGASWASIGKAAETQRRRGRTPALVRTPARLRKPLSDHAWTAIYLAAGYAVCLVPWIGITRCSFIYHYMPSLSFAFLACAVAVDGMISRRDGWRYVGIAGLLLIVAAFIYWLPLYLGLPLSMEEWHSRMWFASWV